MLEPFYDTLQKQLATLAAANQRIGVVDNLYINEPLGIAFRFPSGWRTRDLCEVLRTMEGRLINSHEDDLNEILHTIAQDHVPLVVISAPPLDDPWARIGPHELDPVITLVVEEPLSAPDQPLDLWNHVMTDLALFHAHMEDYKLAAKPAPIRLMGVDAVTYSATYSTRHMDAVEAIPVREQTFYWRQGAAVYGLRLCDYPLRDPRLAFEFGDFASGIYLRKCPPQYR